jgi:hypothetical protein
MGSDYLIVLWLRFRNLGLPHGVTPEDQEHGEWLPDGVVAEVEAHELPVGAVSAVEEHELPDGVVVKVDEHDLPDGVVTEVQEHGAVGVEGAVVEHRQ